MTLNDENNDYSLASEHWIEAYNKTSHVDIESFDTYSTQFFEQVNNQAIDAKNLIGKLCINTFNGFAISSTAKYTSENNDSETEEIPFLTVFLHPFKESRSITFGKKEVLFGVMADDDNPNKEVKTLEFVDPITLFKPWTEELPTTTTETKSQAKSDQNDNKDESTTGNFSIQTPSFFDFFDEKFIKGNPQDEAYQPLNSATEIQPMKEDLTSTESDDKTNDILPEPTYHPRKVIPLSPEIIKIVFEQREYNFDGIIDGIREYAWNKLKSFNKEESRKKFLFLIYRTIQAFWTHGQRETPNGSPMAKFIRCEPEKVAKITTFKWAIDKSIAITEALALSLGKLYPNSTGGGHQQEKDRHGKPSEGTNDRSQHPTARKPRKVSFKDGDQGHDEGQFDRDRLDARLAMAFDNLSATIINTRESKEQLLRDDSWAYKAVRLASSVSKTKPAEKIAKGPQKVAKEGERDARDNIAQDITQRRQAHFRIDKTMAANMRTFKVFRLSPELTGNMSIFHCYPRDTFELQDIISGEELESKLRTKAISAKVVSGYYEQKLGIAYNATIFAEQMFNFWQYNAFMFGDEAWLTLQIGKLYRVIQTLHRSLQSIVDIDRDYILKLAGRMNNDYHLFLTSCIEADGDIEAVEWSFVEDLPTTIANIIKTRSPPNYNTIIRQIANQTRDESKRKLAAEGVLGHTGLTPPRKHRQRERNKNKNRGRDSSDDEDYEREEDPNRTNQNPDPNWKMSGNEFRRVISPNTKSCPKVGERPVCAMFHIIGRCGFGSRCHNHHDELPDPIREEMDKWIKACKEEAKKKNPKKKGGDKKKRDD
jgi:hypothetical protein